MDINEITNESDVKNIVKENKCPFCKEKNVLDNLGPGRIGVVGCNGKYIPTKEWLDFKCSKCGESFTVPKNVYDDYKQS